MNDREREMDATSTLTPGQTVRVIIRLSERHPINTRATVDGTCSISGGVHITLPGGEVTTIFRRLVRPV